jgi:hypothetical protein
MQKLVAPIISPSIIKLAHCRTNAVAFIATQRLMKPFNPGAGTRTECASARAPADGVLHAVSKPTA